jgi:hypothetical protein
MRGGGRSHIRTSLTLGFPCWQGNLQGTFVFAGKVTLRRAPRKPGWGSYFELNSLSDIAGNFATLISEIDGTSSET